ncbi:ABC transporter ATP-binding protein [Amnibacterium kyonggiense]|uniref:Putative ABC transport system ATP-binding protein n=1 Tax=Amnibacterium kyonggiense TaxID=595671 RepID=A0A4R7FME3_9MICO|nr:ATP-binding cassette domain-containing protein [Amnibacterium kyonggiense]TDS77586.1 putative ABC transport system ATP-binding protein [Amnibacterium kyonggiense]
MSAGLPVRAEHLDHEYEAEGERVQALVDVAFQVAAGERLTVVGPSGSGKSTLLTVLAGLQRPTGGRVLVGDQDLTALSETELVTLRRQHLAVVVQDPRRNLLPYGTAVDNVRFAQRPAGRGVRRRDPIELLRSLGLDAVAHDRVDRLSGGERQRIAIAAGLALDPDVLLVDEPTSALDARSRDEVLDLLERVAGEGATLISITHDRVVADRLGGVLVLDGGKVVAP